MKHESFPPTESENQAIQPEQTTDKKRHPSWLRRKTLAGGLAAASLAGIGATEQAQGQESHMTPKQKQMAEISVQYSRDFSMGAEPEALLMAVDEDIQEGKWDKVVGTLPSVVAKLQKHQQFTLALLHNKMMASNAPEAAERKPLPSGSINAFVGASESEMSEMVLKDVVYQIETDNIKDLEVWLPRLIGELQKRLDFARTLQTSEEQNNK
jgi:hypothetical protein